MESWCTDELVTETAANEVNSALPFCCAFLNCSHHHSDNLQCFRECLVG